MKLSFRNCFIFAAFLLILNGCDKPSPQAPNNLAESPADPLIQYLIDLGFRSDTIEDNGDYLIVEGDIAFSKAELEKMIGGLHKITQRATSPVVNYNKVGSIKVFISPGLDAEWTQAANAAITNWNNINDTQLYLDLNSPSDIGIYPDTDPVLPSDFQNFSSTIAGRGETPLSNGNPGRYVSLNMDNTLTDDLNQTVRINQKIYATTHEIGHTIGFFHTNSSDGSQIPRTPTTDGASVMNSGTNPVPQWSSFSAYDITGTIMLYPISLSTPNIWSIWQEPSGIGGLNIIHLQWITDSKAAYVDIWRKKNNGVWELRADNTPNYSNFDDVVSRFGFPTYSYKILTHNFKGDFATGYSNTVTILVN